MCFGRIQHSQITPGIIRVAMEARGSKATFPGFMDIYYVQKISYYLSPFFSAPKIRSIKNRNKSRERMQYLHNICTHEISWSF